MEQEVLEHNLRRSATTRLRQPAASQTQALYLRDSHQLLASFVRFHELNCCFRLATNLLLTKRSFRFLRTPSFPTKARSTYEDCNIIHIAIYQYMLYIIYDAQNDAQKTTFSQTHLPSFSERPIFGLPGAAATSTWTQLRFRLATVAWSSLAPLGQAESSKSSHLQACQGGSCRRLSGFGPGRAARAGNILNGPGPRRAPAGPHPAMRPILLPSKAYKEKFLLSKKK